MYSSLHSLLSESLIPEISVDTVDCTLHTLAGWINSTEEPAGPGCAGVQTGCPAPADRVLVVVETAAGSCPLRRPQVRLGSATLFTVHLVFVQLRFDLQRLPLRPLPLPRSLFSNHCCRGRCCYCCRSPSTHRRIALLDVVAAWDGPIALWIS